METITGLIRDLGFPIFVCLYFMLVQNKRLKEITDELKKFNNQRG